MNTIDADDPEVSDYYFLPHTSRLSDSIKASLQECEDIPRDFTQLYDHSLYQLDTKVLPEVLQAYKDLNLKHEPLKLIQPQFEVPLPPLTLAVFPPIFEDPSGPPLELYDLDEHFSTPLVRLAQETNKCNETDLEYFVNEAARIFGIDKKVSEDKQTAKQYLEFIFHQLVDFKKSNINPEINASNVNVDNYQPISPYVEETLSPE